MSNAAAAGRAASTIGVFKWVIIASQLLAGVILMIVLNAQEDWPTWTAVLIPFQMVGFLLSALFTWVLFGWFQHTLGMLSTIAANTRRADLTYDMQVPSTLRYNKERPPPGRVEGATVEPD